MLLTGLKVSRPVFLGYRPDRSVSQAGDNLRVASGREPRLSTWAAPTMGGQMMKIIGSLSAIVGLAAVAVMAWGILLWAVWPVVAEAARSIPAW